MSAANEAPVLSFAEQVSAEWLSVCESLGYTVDDDEGDPKVEKKLIAEKVFEIVSEAKVSDPSEKNEKAITKADLVTKVFPGVTGPYDSDYGQDEMNRYVWAKCVQAAYSETSPNSTGRVQRWVGQLDGGFTMCRAKVALPNHTETDGVYITNSLECLLDDFSGPLKDSVAKAAEKLAKNLGMITNRQPQFKDKFAKELETGMKNARGSAKTALALTTTTK